jgi:hypothetical protein
VSARDGDDPIVSPRFENWKTQVDRLPENEAEFERWLFVNIASLLFGGKAGELLTLNAGRHQLDIKQQMGRIEKLSPQWGYSFLVLSENLSCAKVVLYREVQVHEMLMDVPRWVFDEINYPHDIGPVAFLNEVGRRWRKTGQIPDEIGLALGYPVKDVLGYMGLVSSSCTGACGWRIFGSVDPSLRKSREFVQAKQQAAAFLEVPAR